MAHVATASMIAPFLEELRCTARGHPRFTLVSTMTDLDGVHSRAGIRSEEYPGY